MAGSAQWEGSAGSSGRTYVLQLENDQLFDIRSFDESGNICRMKTSYNDAARMRLFVGSTGELRDGEVPVFTVKVISATPDERFATFMPNDPGGGEVVGEIVA